MLYIPVGSVREMQLGLLVIDVIDGDIQRVARSLAKSYGKLEDCTFTTKGDAVEFRINKGDTPYRVRIEPLSVEEM